MFLADYMKCILNGLQGLCFIVLAFYLFRVFKFIFVGKTRGDSHRLREAMAMAYTFVAAYFIGSSVNAIDSFVQNIAEAGGLVAVLPQRIDIFLRLCAAFVCAAFICNFSRSLWMLKSLDHAVFEPVPDWEVLSDSSSKRAVEFVTRTGAALLFIFLESSLKELGKSRSAADLSSANTGSIPHSPLTDAGLYGIFLYLCLILWWFSGLWIARKKMPKLLLVFYFAGLVNSVFIQQYGGPVDSRESAILLLIFIVFVVLGALYMLWVVLSDVVRTLWRWLEKHWKGKASVEEAAASA